jgi:hypothetical protein
MVTVMIAQMTVVVNLLKMLAAAEQAMQNGLQQFEQWAQQNLPQVFQELHHDGITPAEIAQGVEAYIKRTFGITITITPTVNLQSMLNQIIPELSSGLQNQLAATAEKIGGELKALNNPLINQIVSLVFHNGQFNAATMQQLENLLNQVLKVMSQIANEESQGMTSGGPSNALVIQMLAMMTTLVNQLQGVITQVASDKGSSDSQVASAFNEQAQQALLKAQAQLQEIEQQEAEQASLGLFQKILDIVITIITGLVSLATGNIVMAVMAITMCVMQQEGAFQKLASAIATDLVKNNGMSQTEANAVADGIVAGITIVATAVVCFGSSFASSLTSNLVSSLTSALKSTVQDGVEEGIEMTAMTQTSNVTTDITETATEAVATETKTAKTIIQKVMDQAVTLAKSLHEGNFFQKLGELNPLRQFSTASNIVINAGVQSIMSTNLISDATTAIMTKEGKSQEEIANAQMIAGIVSAVVGGIISLAATDGLMNGTKALTGATASNLLASLTSKFSSLPKLLSTLFYINVYGGGALQAGSSTAIGISKLQQANLEVAVGQSEATETLMNDYLKVTNNGMQDSQKAFAAILKGHEEIDTMVQQQMLAYEATFAQIFSQAV